MLQVEKQVQREVRSSQFQVDHSVTDLLGGGGQLPQIPSATGYSSAEDQVSPPTFQTRNASERHTLSLNSHILLWERRVRSPTAKINFASHGSEPDFAGSLRGRAARYRTGQPAKCPLQNVHTYTKKLFVVYLKFKWNWVSNISICQIRQPSLCPEEQVSFGREFASVSLEVLLTYQGSLETAGRPRWSLPLTVSLFGGVFLEAVEHRYHGGERVGSRRQKLMETLSGTGVFQDPTSRW